MSKVNVRDYGAKPGMDCAQIFQKAEDDMAALGGGIIKGQNVIYDVSEPFYHRSFNTLDLNGGTIRNSVKTKNGDNQFCIQIGNFAPNTFKECVHFSAWDIKAGEDKVTLSNKANYAFFLIGQTVLIDSTAGFMSDDGHWKPYAAFINRVKSVDTLYGVITLEDAVSIDIIGANIAPTDLFAADTKNDKSYICQYPIIQNVRFESLGDWTMRFGCYKGWFENISLKTTDAIAGNGFSHCTFRNIRAEFSQKVIEMAMYSHDSIVDGLTATWFNGAIDPAIKPVLKFGENQRNCLYNNLTIDTGLGKNFAMLARFEHAFNNMVTNSHFKCKSVAQNGVEFTSNDPNSFITGNEMTNCIFELGNIDSFVKADGAGVVKNNKATGNTVSGVFNKKAINSTADASNIFTPNTFK